MKLYLFELRQYDWDQFDSFVVVAESADDVINYLKQEYPQKDYGTVDWNGGFIIKEIIPNEYTEPQVILGSFNGG